LISFFLVGDLINRRDFLGLLGMGATTAVATSIGLPTASAISLQEFDSLDELTENMLKELSSEATWSDLKPGSYRVEYLDDASVRVRAYVGDYHLDYWGNRHNLKEGLKVSLGRTDWMVTMKNSEIMSFYTYFPMWEFNPKEANALVRRIKDLLDVGVHLKRAQGKDQTDLVSKFLEKAESVEKCDVKYDSVYFTINASHKEGDFKIEYKLDREWLTPRLEIKISDGKDKIKLDGHYNENKGFEDMCLKVNNSNFTLESGKLSEFPIGVYTKASAQGIVNRAEQFAKRLTCTIKNIPLENYTELFERLTSVGDNEFEVIKNFPHTEIKAGKRTISYDSQIIPKITITSPNPGRHTGYDEVYIYLGKKSGKSRRVDWVRINDHGFMTNPRDIRFIPSTYTHAQFKLIMRKAQRFYDFLSERYRG
jgi:hypothetical protein